MSRNQAKFGQTFNFKKYIESYFNYTEMSKIEFDNVKFNNSEFLGTNLNGIDFRNSDISDVSFDASSLKGIILNMFQCREDLNHFILVFIVYRNQNSSFHRKF